MICCEPYHERPYPLGPCEPLLVERPPSLVYDEFDMTFNIATVAELDFDGNKRISDDFADSWVVIGECAKVYGL